MSEKFAAAYSGRTTVIPPAEAVSKSAHVGSMDAYRSIYERALEEPDRFWLEQAKRLDWIEEPTRADDSSFGPEEVRIRWFEDGVLNASVNCLDRHLEARGDQVAFYFEPDEPDMEREEITYRELHEQVCRFANVLKKQGIEKGDRVAIYLPMVPMAAVAMLACARIGAVHSVVFAGFSADALANRINDCGARALITADGAYRGGKTYPLKERADAALEKCATVQSMLLVRRMGERVSMVAGRDVWVHEEMERAEPTCAPEPMKAEDPLFILYTSGSTGQPKGVMHTTGGYMLWTSMTHEMVFDIHEDDVFWCTADVGWITGHSYIVYGPLANGCTQVFFEGTPFHPGPDRLWKVVERYGVTVFYTAPTAIRALMREGDKHLTPCDRSTLRVLGTVGEPINPEAWRWYHEIVGEGRCPIVDTWWQTETGGIMISPLPGATPMKPGSASFPLPGIETAVLDKEGRELEGETKGRLVIKRSWPGQARTIYGDHDRFVRTYFSEYEGVYFTGDGCRRDADGYFWITGRIDDVLIISGHRIGTAEIESALVSHEKIAEAAVVGRPDEIKGHGIYAYVTPKAGVEATEGLRQELIQHVRDEISSIAKPDVIHFTEALPKTRSGKIMRRILRKIASGELENLGDTSTLANPEIVEQLSATRLA